MKRKDQFTQKDAHAFFPGHVAAQALAWLIAVAALMFVALAFWYTYGTASKLPISLIDDEVHLAASEQMWKNMSQGKWLRVITDDPSARLMNPGYALLRAIVYRLTGGQPFHVFKLATLAFILVTGILLPGVLSRAPVVEIGARHWIATFWRRMACHTPATLFAGALGACIILFAEVDNVSDMQGLRANWMRLHTTDSWMAMFLCFHVIAVAASIRATGRRHTLSVLAAGLLLFTAISCKPTAIVMVAPLIVLGIVEWLARRRSAGLVCIVTAAIVAVVALGMLLCLRSLFRDIPEAYNSTYSLESSNLHSGIRYLAVGYWKMLGPIAIWFPLALLARWLDRLRSEQRIHWRVLLEHEAFVMYLIFAFVLVVAVYVPWPQRLGRYFVVHTMLLAMLMAIETANQIAWLRPYGVKAFVLAILGIICILALPVRIIFLLALLALVLGTWKRHLWQAGSALSGVAVVGFLYFCVGGWLAVPALRVNYIEREIGQAALTTTVGELAQQGHSIGFFGDVMDEHIGSMAGQLSRAGKPARIEPVNSQSDVQKVDYVMISELLSPRQRAPLPQGARIESSFGPKNAKLRVPVTFWEWRGRLWHDQTINMMQPYAAQGRWLLFRIR